MHHDKFNDITFKVHAETIRQDRRWGKDRSNPGTLWVTILMEEVGEVAKAILEKDEPHAQEELIQVAALCYQIINDMNKKNE